VLTKEIGIRAREIIRQACDHNGIQIIKGLVSKDHIHLYNEVGSVDKKGALAGLGCFKTWP